MSTHAFARCLLALSVLSAAACGRFDYQESYNNAREPFATSADDKTEPSNVTVDDTFIDLMKTAEKATLYEGLPHQKHEPALLDHEKETKKTVLLDDFAFYEESLDLKEGDLKELAAILSNPESLTSTSEKGCCIFHPDYLIEWYAAGETRKAYFCFGCGDIKLVGPNGETKYGLSAEARTKLENVLFGYHKNRPDSEGWLKLTQEYKARKKTKSE